VSRLGVCFLVGKALLLCVPGYGEPVLTGQKPFISSEQVRLCDILQVLARNQKILQVVQDLSRSCNILRDLADSTSCKKSQDLSIFLNKEHIFLDFTFIK
jgi:hypothetical protein